MVVWKGETERKHGEKAYNLDQVDLDVPNFFVITSEELKEMFQTRNPERILNSSIDIEEIRDAYREVGMSSEVRNASSRARNLVGGQRGNSKVTVRASDEGVSEFELDVGASGLEDAIKNVTASFIENNSEFPSIIVQKMIEAEYTGALIKGRRDYVEVVEGLGIPLEQGKTSPSRYLIGREMEFESPEIQLKVTQNPMTGDYREKRMKSPERPFSDSEIREFAEEASQSVKFVYKRGSFFAVDAFNSEREVESVEEIEVSGQLQGTVGREIKLSEETLPPEEYDKGLVARKGGFTSNDAEKARKAGKAAVFSSNREEGEKIGVSTSEVSGSKASMRENISSSSQTATEIFTINELETGFTSDQTYIENYSEVFSFEGGEAILDARIMPDEGLENALDYIEGEVVVLLDEPDQDILLRVVENGFSVGVDQDRLDIFESVLGKVEQKFILEKLRKLE